ncbi:MAG: hypothetical protein IPH68_11515 [Chitinophagaceae bacterium]|nr:hypothetical protein [Chitinophagaceae bacterium]
MQQLYALCIPDCRIGPVADMYHTHIGAAYLAKSIQVIVAHLVGTAGGSNHFNTAERAAGFFHNAAEDTEFKKVQVIAMDLSFSRSVPLSSAPPIAISFPLANCI